MKEEELLTNKEIRNKNLDRVEVLEKVKDLILLGNTEYATTRQVAEYFDVDESVITMCCQNNKEELKDNGLLILTGKKTKEKLVSKNNLASVPSLFAKNINLSFNSKYSKPFIFFTKILFSLTNSSIVLSLPAITITSS